MTTDSPSQLVLRKATAADFEFAHEVTRGNMENYVVRHWGAWSRDIFTENYNKGRNFILWAADTRVGYVRLLPQPPLLVLDDLQVVASQQRRGFGSFMLAHLDSLLPEFDCTHIRLRVFHENPARKLYLRAGFQEIERSDNASILQRSRGQ